MSDYRRLIKFVLPHVWVLALASACMVVATAFSGVSMGAIIPLVDNIIRGKKVVLNTTFPIPAFLGAIVDRINSMPPMVLLNKMVIIVLCLWLLRNFFEFCRTYCMNDVSQRVIRDIKNIIYQKILTLSMDFYSKNPTGKLVSRITHDAGIVRDSISTGLTDLLYQPIQLMVYIWILIMVKILFSISWLLVVASLVLFPLVIYPVVVIGRRLKVISRRSQEQMAGISTTLYETISGIRVVKAFSMENYESDRFTRQNSQLYKLAMKSIKRMVVVSPITEFVGLFCIAIVLWIAGKQILSGELSCGAFMMFLAALLSLMKPIKRLSNVYSVNQQALAAARRIFEILDTESNIIEKPRARELKRFSDKISFDGVYFRYDDKDVLKDINLDVKAGEIVAFVGSSGVGKTSLVNLVPRFYDVTKGSVKIDGVDIRDVTLISLRAQVGIVTQDTILFNDTVASNIAYGKPSPQKDDIIRAAKIANAHSFIMNMPQGYDTVIGERGFRLSGGEKQRIAIARAVFKDPPILILDEATSQLDTESEILVQEAINKLMRGRTVLVIAHRLSTITHANKIFVLDEGRVAEVGSHEDLVASGGLYKRLYNLQFREGILR